VNNNLVTRWCFVGVEYPAVGVALKADIAHPEAAHNQFQRSEDRVGFVDVEGKVGDSIRTAVGGSVVLPNVLEEGRSERLAPEESNVYPGQQVLQRG